MAAPARRAPSPSASTTYSGISGYRSESYRTGNANSPRPAVPATDPRAIARTHYEELKRSLQDHMLREPQNSRANAREKLTRLTRQQFQELSTDVYDELMRRNNNEKGGTETPFLPVRDDFHPKRNQARQKLATLPAIRFKDLSSDVFYELGRRYPEFKEPETLPETPDTPQSDYDPPTPELVGGRAPMRQASRDQSFSAGGGAGSGSDRRRPSQDDYGVRRRPSEDEPRRQPSVDDVRRRPSGDEGPYRRPSQDAVNRRPSQDKPVGTASSSYVTPNKSTIAEEVIQVPYGRDEGTEDEDYEDRDDPARRPGSDEDPSRHSKKPSQGGLNALGFSLLSTPLSPTSDDGAVPNGLNGRATSDYYEKMSFGRASVTSSQGGGGERRNTEIEDVRREYEFKIATMQSKLSALEDKARSEGDHEIATQLVERLRATLSNLVAAARTHAMSYGTSPVSLLDAAASHVSTTVTSLVREVLVRRDDGRRGSGSGSGLGGSWTQLEDELNGRRPISDRSSSVGSPQNPAIFDTPLQTASTSGNGVGSDDSTLVEGSDEGWEELKPYLEAQSESIAFSIQALLSAIRTGAQGPEINENLTQIITIVSSIVAVSKESLPRGGVKQGLEIIGLLTEQCDRLSELQGRAELSKQERQTMASNSFGVAKAMKELMKLA
ncbi:component of the polarisome [Ceratobasidium sp. 392]|nr:component of the polarisome [Ceratobasidium sp. 392]